MKPIIYQRSVAILATCWCSSVPLLSQSYDLSWSTVDGGGGHSSGGAYSVGGTIGQPDAGQLAGGSFRLIGGFWGVVEAVQSEGAPWLSVTRSGANVVVKWSFPSTEFVLQQAAGLGSPSSALVWTDVTTPASLRVGSDWTATFPSPVGNRFFRLRKP